jgi:preprotein translocase subunit YajC
MAMDSGAATLGSSLVLFLPLLALVGYVFYSQRKRQRSFADLQSALAVGDEVVTTSGMFGTIAAMDAKSVTLDAGGGVRLRFDRRAVGMKSSPPAPADGQPTTSGE